MKLTLLGLALLAPVAFGPSAYATDHYAAAPCKFIVNECRHAKTEKGDFRFAWSTPKGRADLNKNCVEPILRHQAPEGLSVSDTFIIACKKKLTAQALSLPGPEDCPTVTATCMALGYFPETASFVDKCFNPILLGEHSNPPINIDPVVVDECRTTHPNVVHLSSN